MEWGSIVGMYVKKKFGKTQVSINDKSYPESNLQISECTFDECMVASRNLEQCCTKSTSTTGLNFSQRIGGIFNTLHDSTEGAQNVQTPNGNDPGKCDASYINTMVQDMVEQSLQGMQQQLEGQRKQIYATDLSERIAKNKTQNNETEKCVEQDLKSLKETIKLQHRETRRRLEKVEKKTNAGHLEWH